ncbi:ABC transporter permease [Thermovibrio sp.]
MRLLLVSYAFIALTLFFDGKFSVGLRRELLTSSFLSLIQLLLIGFVILFFLKEGRPWLNLIFVLFFYFNAALIALKRLRAPFPKVKSFVIVFSSLSALTTFSLFLLFLAGVLTLKATSIIPLAGIVSAAGMRSLSLAFKYFVRRVKDLEDALLGMAALGAGSRELFNFILKEIIDDITVPVRDMFRSAGIVHIPGVMVGLLLAGVFPLKAALVQFLILSTMVFQFTFTPTITLGLFTAVFGFKIFKEGP